MITEQIVRVETDGNETKAEVVGEIVRCRECRYYLNSNEKCILVDMRLAFYEMYYRWDEDSFCCWGKGR